MNGMVTKEQSVPVQEFAPEEPAGTAQPCVVRADAEPVSVVERSQTPWLPAPAYWWVNSVKIQVEPPALQRFGLSHCWICCELQLRSLMQSGILITCA